MQRVRFSCFIFSFDSGVTPGVVSTLNGSVMARMTVAMRQTSVTVLEGRAEATKCPVAMVIV